MVICLKSSLSSMADKKYRVASLFSGCGGLDLGFKDAGYELVFAADNDPYAIDAYRRNVDKNAYVLDVTSPAFHAHIASLKNIDVVLGGFPCQGFSKAGPKRVEDERNHLYKEMLAAVEAISPAVFLAENVDGLRQNFGGNYLKKIVSDFSKIGYSVEYRVIDFAIYGIAQHRRRIVFIGMKDGNGFIWPTPKHRVRARNGESRLSLHEHDGLLPEPVAVRDSIDDLGPLGAYSDHQIIVDWPKKYEYVFARIGEGQKLCNVRFSNTSVYTWQIPEVFGGVSIFQKKILETIGKNRRKKIYGDIPNGNPIPLREITRLIGLNHIPARDITDLEKKGYIKKIGDGYDLKGAMFCSGLFKRIRHDKPSPTILTNFYNPRFFLHPSENRPLSLRECARLQGFPDSFKICSSWSKEDLIAGYRLVGNAVPPIVGKEFAVAIKRYLKGRKM